MSLKDGRHETGEVPAATQGGVLFSPSEGDARVGATAIGLDLDPDINELNRIRPLLPSSTKSLGWSFGILGWLSFALLCSFWMSRREVGPFKILAPPHAGPSLLGGGGGATSLGALSSAPLRNIDKPPFLFFFFDEVGWEVLVLWGSVLTFKLRKGCSSRTWLLSVSLTSVSSYQKAWWSMLRETACKFSAKNSNNISSSYRKHYWETEKHCNRIWTTSKKKLWTWKNRNFDSPSIKNSSLVIPFQARNMFFLLKSL